MSIRIDDGSMSLEIDDRSSRPPPNEPRLVGSHPLARFFDRNQAITALTVTELLESGRDNDDPVMTALREELR